MAQTIRRTEGLRLMEEALAKRGWSGNELARQLSADSGLVSRWRNGKRVPERDYAIKLQVLLGVPIESWGRAIRPSRPPKHAA